MVLFGRHGTARVKRRYASPEERNSKKRLCTKSFVYRLLRSLFGMAMHFPNQTRPLANLRLHRLDDTAADDSETMVW